MSSRWRRSAAIVAALIVAGAATVAIPAVRHASLRIAGRMLVVPETAHPESANVIIVAVDADGAGVLEAVDLVRSGVSARVAVFADRPDAVDIEFVRRGIPHQDAATRSLHQLRALGVDNVELISTSVDGSEYESEVLPAWCDQHGFRSVVIVSTSDHSRRLRRMLHRSMKGHQTRVTVVPARHSPFDPDRWWLTRDGVRTGIVELEKLLYDVVRHPIS